MRAARAILVGGLVVGTLDALDAIVFFGLRSGATPGRIFQGIAVPACSVQPLGLAAGQLSGWACSVTT